MPRKTIRPQFENKRSFIISVGLSFVVILSLLFFLTTNHGVRLFVHSDGRIRLYSNKHVTGNVSNIFPTRAPAPTPGLRFDDQTLQKNISMILNEEKAPELDIDTTNWIEYYDENTKMSFKYPMQWGEPTSEIFTGNDELSSGSSFYLTFSANNDISVDGVSEDFGVPRGFHGFKGFIEDSKRGRTPEEFCEKQKEDFLYCHRYKNAVLALTGKESCYHLAWFYEMYNLNYYLDFPDEYLIDGVQFRADFLSDKYRDLMNGYTCNNRPARNTDNSTEIHRVFNQALLDRRLDEETMNRYDILKTFYETIEVH